MLGSCGWAVIRSGALIGNASAGWGSDEVTDSSMWVPRCVGADVAAISLLIPGTH